MLSFGYPADSAIRHQASREGFSRLPRMLGDAVVTGKGMEEGMTLEIAVIAIVVALVAGGASLLIGSFLGTAG